MAPIVPIAGAPAGTNAKARSGWLVLLWSVVTFGIYGIYWWYSINRELADVGGAHGTDELGTQPIVSTLAYALGGFLVVPVVWTWVTTFKRIQRAQRLVGVPEVASGWRFVAITVVTLGIGAAVVLQRHQNTVLHRQAGPLPAVPPDTVFGNGTPALASAR
jgi:membrane protease YdiL (CAAX protease family)